MDEAKRKILMKIFESKILKYLSFVLVVSLLIYMLFENSKFSYLIPYGLLLFNITLIISSSVNSFSKKVYYKKYLNKEYNDIFLKYLVVILAIFLLILLISNGFSLITNLKGISVWISFVSLSSFTLDQIYHSL